MFLGTALKIRTFKYDSLSMQNLPKFEDLKTSTRTLMVYTNVEFDHEKIFRGIKWTPIEVPLTKKKKNVDKKRLQAPYGSIIGIQYGDKLRGINLRKNKPRSCGVCQPSTRSKTRKKINTVNERLVFEDPDSDIQTFKYYCSSCKKLYNGKELENPLTHFLNQITVVLAIENIILNIMLFKNSFKIAGCKKNKDAEEATMILWENHIRPIVGGFKLPPKEDPHFLFLLVMRNVDFRLGFPIDRQKLNRLMNSTKYKDKINMSQCETTSHTNVNIKMFSRKPQNYRYDCLVIPNDTLVRPFFKKMEKNPYRSKKSKKKKYMTFIVFSSSEVILSGRYEENMKNMYEFFIQEAYKHRDLIEEKIETPKVDLMSFLESEKNESL